MNMNFEISEIKSCTTENTIFDLKKFKHTTNDVHTVKIEKGMKICFISEVAFIEAQKFLIDTGFEINCNEDNWSIYINGK